MNVEFKFEKLEPNARMTSLLKYGLGAYNVDHRGESKDNHGRIACHSFIRSISDHENLTNYVGRLKYVPGFKEWWSYLTSYESPFGDLFRHAPDGWSLICEDPTDIKTVVAFRAPDEVFDFEVYPLLYAFLICSRMCYEYQDDVKSLSWLIKKGVEPNFAFLMCRFLSINLTNGSVTIKNGGWDGAHKALAEYDGTYGLPCYIDVKLWLAGKYVSEGIRYNTTTRNLWLLKDCPSKSVGLSKFMWGAYCVEKKTRLGAVFKTLEPESFEKMMEDFNKFIELRYAK